MSDNTPILITLSDICAWAAPAASALAMPMASALRVIAFIKTPPALKIVRSNPEVLVQLVHVPFELGVRDHVDDRAVLHHVMPIRHRRGEVEILPHEQDREALGAQLADRAA